MGLRLTDRFHFSSLLLLTYPQIRVETPFLGRPYLPFLSVVFLYLTIFLSTFPRLADNLVTTVTISIHPHDGLQVIINIDRLDMDIITHLYRFSFSSLVLLLLVQLIKCRVLYVSDMPPAVETDKQEFTNRLNQTLLVLAVPSIFDEYYQEKFGDIMPFYRELIHSIMPYDNVLVLGDGPSLSQLKKPTKHHEELPGDILLESDMYDIFLNDYAPQGKNRVKFHYQPAHMDKLFVQQVEKGFVRFLSDNSVELRESQLSQLVLDGGDVVENGKNKAIFTSDVFQKNRHILADWAVMIQMLNLFGRSVFLRFPDNSTLVKANSSDFSRLMSFMEEKLLVVSTMEEWEMTPVLKDIRRGFPDVQILEMPVQHHSGSKPADDKSTCGFYTGFVATDKAVYMPVFGNDPKNWRFGHSTAVDRQAIDLLRTNTRKNVVPVNIPHSLCSQGGSLNRLIWKLQGPMADKLISSARIKAFHPAKKVKFVS